MRFEFLFFNYLVPYIVIYIVFGIAMTGYKNKYEDEYNSDSYARFTFGRYYFQRIIINLSIIILSINNYLIYNRSVLSGSAIICFSFLIIFEIIVFFCRGTEGTSYLSDYLANKLNIVFTITNKFKVKKKVNNNFINNKEN